MRAPDGGYEEGFVVPGSSTSPKRVSRSGGNLETNNPLSLHNEVYTYRNIRQGRADLPHYRILGPNGSLRWNCAKPFYKM